MKSSDETTFRMLKAWQKHVVVRRGGRTTVKVTLDATAEQFDKELTDQQAVQVEAILGGTRTDPDLAAAARAYLAGEPTPLGAAGATAARLWGGNPGSFRWWEHVTRLVDLWVARHGLLFAVQAVAELGRLGLDATVEPPALRRWQPEDDCRLGDWSPAANRIRAMLAVAGDTDYKAAVNILTGYRDGRWPRLLAAYLVPDQTQWGDELCAEAADIGGSDLKGPWSMLLCAISTVRQLDAFVAAYPYDRHRSEWGSSLLTLTDALGEAIAPFAADMFDVGVCAYYAEPGLALDVLAAIPTDEAFDLLSARIARPGVRPMVLKAMERFPVRATRLLAPLVANDPDAADLLTRHLRARSEVLTADLPEDVRSVAASIMAADEQIRELLPELLVRPPWTRPRSPRSGRQAAPVVIEDLPAPAPPRIVWEAGERAEWARAGESRGYWAYLPDWAAALSEFSAGTLWYEGVAEVLVNGPEESVRPLLAEWRPKDLFLARMWGKQAVARFGLDARSVALHIASTQSVNGVLLLPFVDAEIADLMADWLVRLKSARKDATAWLLRHAEAAAPMLVARALGTPGPARTNAQAALRFLSANGQDVRAVAARYGAEAHAAIDSALAADPTEVLPAKIPTPGAWLAETPLPRLLLRDGATRLPGWAVDHVITMLAMSRPDSRYAGLDVVGEICDPRSLADFGWRLVESWSAADKPPKDGWVLTALAWSGDDDTVRRLSATIRAWSDEGRHALAVAGLDVLVGIGTGAALVHLDKIAHEAKSRGLRSRAQEKIAEVELARLRSRGLGPA